jgi:hypothetical protein
MRLVKVVISGLALCGHAQARADAHRIPNMPRTHSCPVFGGTSGGMCEEYPTWSDGWWRPPAHVGSLHVLVVGGGGGGCASIQGGSGGAGGASGKVIVATLPADGSRISVIVGRPGPANRAWGTARWFGGASTFGLVVASGGEAGVRAMGGRSVPGPGGASGGGGGGHYESGTHGGSGGQGGTGGADGAPGDAGSDAGTIPGAGGGSGTPFPGLGFTMVSVTAGAGGAGGLFFAGPRGFGGGGGGGGGGVLIAGTGGNAAAGGGGLPMRGAQGGAPGHGYGAGGGGGGNVTAGTPGGAGAAGVVYVEWPQEVASAE